MSSWLESIYAHPAFFLLRNCLSIPRLLFKLRSYPCYRLHTELTQFDETLRQAVSTVCIVNFDDTWCQRSTLPVALGLSAAVNMSLPAYASSLSATRQLVGQILQGVFECCPTSEVDSVAERWTELGHELITTDKKPFQRYWSSAVHEALFRSLKAGSAQSSSPHFNSCPRSLRRLDYCLLNRSGWDPIGRRSTADQCCSSGRPQLLPCAPVSMWGYCPIRRPSSTFKPFQCWSISSTLRNQQHHKKIT